MVIENSQKKVNLFAKYKKKIVKGDFYNPIRQVLFQVNILEILLKDKQDINKMRNTYY